MRDIVFKQINMAKRLVLSPTEILIQFEDPIDNTTKEVVCTFTQIYGKYYPTSSNSFYARDIYALISFPAKPNC